MKLAGGWYSPSCKVVRLISNIQVNIALLSTKTVLKTIKHKKMTLTCLFLQQLQHFWKKIPCKLLRMNSKWYYSEFELPIRALLHWYSLFLYMLLIVSIIAQVIIEMCTLWLVGNFSYLAIISSLFVNVSKEVLNAIEYFLSWLFNHNYSLPLWQIIVK